MKINLDSMQEAEQPEATTLSKERLILREHERALVFELQRKSRAVSLLLTGSCTPGTRARLTPG